MQDIEIAHSKYQDIPEFTLQGVFDYKAVRVYDGDTLYVAIYINGRVCRINCRILQINTTEMPPSNAEAMSSTHHAYAYRARDRLVELITNVDLEKARKDAHYLYHDTIGNTLPSFSDAQLQKIIDEENTLVISRGLILEKVDNFGRYLAHIKSKDGKNVSRVLLDEELAFPFDSTIPFYDPFQECIVQDLRS